MSAPYTTRFFSGATTLEKASTVVVPGGKRWVLRDVEVYNGVASAGVVTVAGIVVILVAAAQVATGAYHGSWQGRVVAMPGEPVACWTNPSGGWITLTGYEFSS